MFSIFPAQFMLRQLPFARSHGIESDEVWQQLQLEYGKLVLPDGVAWQICEVSGTFRTMR